MCNKLQLENGGVLNVNGDLGDDQGSVISRLGILEGNSV